MYTNHLPPASIAPRHGPKFYVAKDLPFCVPPCECVDCIQQYRSETDQGLDRFVYESVLSDDQVSKTIQDCVRSLSDDFTFLRQRCASFGNTLMSRWKKKSRDKRQATLLEVDSSLYPHLWFHPRTNYEDHNWKQARPRRVGFLLPYLSLEILREDHMKLLSLLSNRTRYSPADWAPFDNQQISTGWDLGLLGVDHSSKCISMRPSSYGKVTSWEREAAHRWDIVGFPRGRLILEAQQYLLHFLRNMVEHLLQGVDVETPGALDKWAELARIGFKQTNSVEFCSPYLHQAFSAPPVFNIDSLLSLAETQAEAAEDHLWFLQTDPSYVRGAINSIKAGATLDGARREDTMSLIAADFARDAEMCTQWRWVQEEFRNVKNQHQRFQDNIHPGEPLPLKYDRALGALELLLINQMHEIVKHLTAFIPDRPGFRKAYNHDHSIPGQVSRRRISKAPQGRLFFEDPLEWCLTQLLGDPDQKGRFDHAMLFAFLDDCLTKSSATERARIDQRLYDKLSDLAATHQLLVAVRLHRPLNTNLDISDVRKTEDRAPWKVFRLPSELPKSSINISVTNAKSAKLIQDFIDLPVPRGKQDISWLEQSDALRQTLTAFWVNHREDRKSLLHSDGLSEEEIKAALAILCADSDTEHLAALAQERARILSKLQPSRIKPEIVPLQQEWESSFKPRSTDPPVREPKIKSRPPTSLVESEVTIRKSVPTDDTTKRLSIPVKKQTYVTLSYMFPADAEESTKTVEWNTFVQAMADTGFTARHNGGSAVIFAKGSSGGRIVFHKPHPVAKIDPVIFRSMGRRMSKWFDWDKDTFYVS